MKGKIIGFTSLIIVLIVIACSKDKFQTKPSLTLKSISGKTIPAGSDMRIELDYTDKEGDIVQDTIQFIKNRNNQRKVATKVDTLYFLLPDFPKRSSGVFEVNLSYETFLKAAINAPSLPGGRFESDSLTFKFILKDNASNVSDTLVINDIVIERNN
ncbi:MAG: hypothetical protein H7Y03_10720 [Chitinophagaceae bacterium]|nr:hypothetical protein [Chitinophagaceae bacterium]